MLVIVTLGLVDGVMTMWPSPSDLPDTDGQSRQVPIAAFSSVAKRAMGSRMHERHCNWHFSWTVTVHAYAAPCAYAGTELRCAGRRGTAAPTDRWRTERSAADRAT